VEEELSFVAKSFGDRKVQRMQTFSSKCAGYFSRHHRLLVTQCWQVIQAQSHRWPWKPGKSWPRKCVPA